MSCASVDELAGAYALGAVDPDEEQAISDHLATCAEPHREIRELIGAAGLLPAAVPPVEPSSGLRGRLMATVDATPQEHRRPVAPPSSAAPDAVRAATPPRRWSFGALPAALAAVALAAVVGLGAWNVTLNQQLAERDAAIRAVAAADLVVQVTGSAGSGLLLERDGEATFLADELAALPPGSLYELWLIGPDGSPVPVGTLTETGGIALVPLERALGPATTFAVTVEEERVDAPTSDPVLVASLEG